MKSNKSPYSVPVGVTVTQRNFSMYFRGYLFSSVVYVGVSVCSEPVVQRGKGSKQGTQIHLVLHLYRGLESSASSGSGMYIYVYM